MAREYYSIPEAAALLGISRIAVFKKVKNGQAAALRFGRNWAVPAAEIERLGALAARRNPTTPPPAPAVSAANPGEGAKPAPPSDSDMDSMGWD